MTEDRLSYLKLCKNSFDFPVDILTFNLKKREERISLSWRLTKKEKKKIANMIHSKENQLALDQLNHLLSQANKRCKEKTEALKGLPL